jgi:hypothetical protein
MTMEMPETAAVGDLDSRLAQTRAKKAVKHRLDGRIVRLTLGGRTACTATVVIRSGGDLTLVVWSDLFDAVEVRSPLMGQAPDGDPAFVTVPLREP